MKKKMKENCKGVVNGKPCLSSPVHALGQGGSEITLMDQC